jgi:hypothetical protein
MIKITERQQKFIDVFKNHRNKIDLLFQMCKELNITRSVLHQYFYRLVKKEVFCKVNNTYELTEEQLIVVETNQIKRSSKNKEFNTIKTKKIKKEVFLNTTENLTIVSPKTIKPVEYYPNGKLKKVPLPQRY